MKLVVIIPAYNEEKTISRVIKGAKKYVDEVIVVDDNSKDNTYLEAKKAGAIALKHQVNLGKGATLKTGCEAALLRKADVFVILDGDGQHDPDEIPLFLEKLKEFDMVFSKRIERQNMPLFAKVGNTFFSFITRILFGINISDPQSGYRAFTKNCYKKITWTTSGYSVENEMIARISAKKIKYTEIPIKTIYHEKYKGTTIVDGISIFVNILMLRLKIWR